MGKLLNSVACILITFQGLVLNQAPLLKGKWHGQYLEQPIEIEFSDPNKACVRFQKTVNCYEYHFVNDGLQIGVDTHRIHVLNDTTLVLKPLKVMKDVAILDLVVFSKIR